MGSIEMSVKYLLCSEVYLGSYLNIETGELAWRYLDEKEDVLQSVMGMSQMSSMLKDRRRNEAYNGAISGFRLFFDLTSECIHDFIQQHGRKPYVLDIGCGTGLLSLQAARAGAEKVFGCEMFRSWAEIAAKNVAENGFENVITIFNKHSSALTVEGFPPCRALTLELGQRCDILVSEILDTVLLGEGVLKAVRDAKVPFLSACQLETPSGPQRGHHSRKSRRLRGARPLSSLLPHNSARPLLSQRKTGSRRRSSLPRQPTLPRFPYSTPFPSLDPRLSLHDRVVLCAHAPHDGGSDRHLQPAPATPLDPRPLRAQRPALRLGPRSLPRPPALLHAGRRAGRLGGPLAAGLLPALRPRSRRAGGLPRRPAARHQLEVRRLRAAGR